MKKTFITENDKNWIDGMKVRSGNLIKKVNELAADAIDNIVDLFENFDINSIDIANYDEDFRLVMENYLGDTTQVSIKKVELYEGTIYVYDTEDHEYTSEDWYIQAPQLLQEMATCLETKLSDIQNLAVGKKVRWIDPEIEDYDEEDREDMLNRIFTIYSCPDVIERDSIIGISCDGSEAEVLPMELVLMPD